MDRFAGRRALDIGTNEGLIPLSLAVRFCTASFHGVDIDHDLVHKARCTWHTLLRWLPARRVPTALRTAQPRQLPLSCLCCGPWQAKVKHRRLQQSAEAAAKEAARLPTGSSLPPDRAALARAAAAISQVSFRQDQRKPA